MGLAAIWPSTDPPPVYRPRQFRNTPLYQLLGSYYDDVKQRGICPSCDLSAVALAKEDAKRAAAFGAFLKDELLENVGHCLWTFTLPKMLRPYFVRDRELLGDLARLAYETIKELMIEAVGNDKARPGGVAVPQTFGNSIDLST